MSDLVVTLLFDCMLAILLIATISYCSKLSRRLRLLQDSRGELAGVITQFDNATNRATAAIAELQTVSKKITEALQLKIDKANFLADDLAFLIEKSTKLATQLEQQAKAQRLPAGVVPSADSKPAANVEPKPLFFEASEKPLTKTIIMPPPAATQANAATGYRNASSLEAILQRLAPGVAVNGAAKPAAEADEKPALRTGAERELLEALKSSSGR